MKYVLIFPIILYRATISKWLPRSCRFTPSCSEYSVIVLSRFGVFKGSFLTIKRILKCNPFSNGGFDPPPEK